MPLSGHCLGTYPETRSHATSLRTFASHLTVSFTVESKVCEGVPKPQTFAQFFFTDTLVF